MDLSTHLEGPKNRASINCSGECEHIGQNSNILHFSKELESLHRSADVDISSHERGPRYNICVGHFVKQSVGNTCFVEFNVRIEEIIGGENVVYESRFDNFGMGLNCCFEILGVSETVCELGLCTDIQMLVSEGKLWCSLHMRTAQGDY